MTKMWPPRLTKPIHQASWETTCWIRWTVNYWFHPTKIDLFTRHHEQFLCPSLEKTTDNRLPIRTYDTFDGYLEFPVNREPEAVCNVNNPQNMLESQVIIKTTKKKTSLRTTTNLQKPFQLTWLKKPCPKMKMINAEPIIKMCTGAKCWKCR